MANIKLDLSYSGVSDKEISRYGTKITKICDNLMKKADDENEFVGWLNLPTNYNKKEFDRIKKAAKRIRKNSEVFVVIGIGGSYLGARAVIEGLTSNFANIMPDNIRKSPQIFFVGNSISPNYINELIENNAKNWSIDRFSKIDLSILQIAIAEMLSDLNIPDKVSINEAIDLAKMYCEEKTPKFINGILGSVVNEIKEK